MKYGISRKYVLTADQITADRNHGLAALRPQHGDDIGGARAPIETTENGFVDLERIHERDRVDRERRRLAVADRAIGEKTRRSVSAVVRHDHAIARRRQDRSDIDKAVNVIGPAMQQNDRRTVGRTGFGIADIEKAS